MERDLQLSLLPDLRPDKPVGPVPQTVQHVSTNAELIAAVAPIYLTGSVLDVTYGRGKWWDTFRPEPFAYHDLRLDGVDFRYLPELAQSWDTVVFDPPYVESGSRTTSSRRDFLDGFGLGTDADGRVSPVDTWEQMRDGLAEACRVARRFVLVKCMEYVAWHRFHDAPTAVILEADRQGWRLHDRIVHASGGGVGGTYRIRTVKRCERAHSYLLVFAPVADRAA